MLFSDNYQSGLNYLLHDEFTQAEHYFLQSIEDFPHQAEVWSDLGIAVFKQGRLQEGLAYFKKSIEIDPNYAKGWNNLGNGLRECGLNDQSATACLKALQLQPGLYDAHHNYALSLIASGRQREAATCLLKATQLQPHSDIVWINAGDACRESGNPVQAASCFRRALNINPDNMACITRLADILLSLCHHDKVEKIIESSLGTSRGTAAELSAQLMILQYLPHISQCDIKNYSESWNVRFGSMLPWLSPIDSSKRSLRIGYVSADFHRHPVGIFTTPLLRYHDRNSFSLYCYSNNIRGDEVTTELKSYVHVWRTIAGMNDHDVAALIRSDQIDILIDLSGHTAGNRLPVFALRAAPVQISCIGYCHTTGLQSVDYIISDSDTILPDEDHYYSEQVERLPHSRFCYHPPEFVPDVETSPAATYGAVTFGSFNNPAKIHEGVVALWASVLQAVPGSRMILKWKTFARSAVRKRFTTLFSKYGVEPSRLEFREASSHFLMMSEYGDIDIALDTFLFSGGLTTCEALWMGVPVITLSGDTPISRQSASFLKLVGLSNCIATNSDEYRTCAVNLSSNIELLSQLRSCLRKKMQESPLCDEKRYTADVEATYYRLWNKTVKHLADNRTELFDQAFSSAACFFNRKQFCSALEIYDDILNNYPCNARALQGRGMSLAKSGQLAEGIDSVQKALEKQPDHIDYYYNLGNLLKEANRLNEAEAIFNKGLALVPEYGPILTNLAGNYWVQGKISEAIIFFQKALEIQPENGSANSGLLLSLNYSHEHTPEDIFAAHKSWGQSLYNSVTRYTRWSNDRNETRSLRIGYVSADLGQHPVGYFMVNPIRNRNRSVFNVYCYSNRESSDNLTLYFQEHSDGWRNIYGLGDEDVCSMIRNDRIDILVDLSGHTSGCRLSLFAHQPAPIQVSWLGYPNTTGLHNIQYRLTDAIVDPPGFSDTIHTEQLVRLPSGFLCYFPSPDSPLVGPLPYKTNRYITFGSFNNLSKITPEVIATWAHTMLAVPDSRLLVKRSSFRDAQTVSHFQAQFEKHGIDLSRIDLIPSTETHAEHMNIYNSVDIALDSFPYNGTTTTCEALWMGVPVIVLAGERHAGRVGMSILSRVGLDEFIATSPDEYVLKAAALAKNTKKLEQLRDFLRDRMDASPLCNGFNFCPTLENAYREMWKTWCRNTSCRTRKPTNN